MMNDQSAQRIASRRLTIPPPLRYGLLGWLFGRSLYFLLGLALSLMNLIPKNYPTGADNPYNGLQPIDSGWQGAVWGVWQRWDAIHYIRIAEQGYQSDLSNLTAFFPLYPYLGRLVSFLTGLDTLPALLLISDLAAIGALALLYVLAQDMYSPKAARWSIAVMLAFPWAFFLFAPYADGLSLFLVLLAVYLARRSRWGLAGLAGLAAGLTRPSALPLAILLGWWAVLEWRRPSGVFTRLLALAAAASPVVGALAFEAWRVSLGASSYTSTQQGWGRSLRLPWESLLHITNLFQSPLWWVYEWITLTFFVLQIVVLVYGLRRIPWAYTVYFLGSILFLLSTENIKFPLLNWGRHSLLLFPFFILIAGWMSHHARPGRVLLLISWTFSVYLCCLLFLWIFI